MVNRSSIATAAVMISIPLVFGLVTQAHEVFAVTCCIPTEHRAPVIVSGSNMYTAWNNNASVGNNNASVSLLGVPVFFTKSNDSGKTFSKTLVISTPNTNPKTFVINKNISISASGKNVAVTWWTNKSGTFKPVIRTSSNGGNTFASIIRLNSTPGGINK